MSVPYCPKCGIPVLDFGDVPEGVCGGLDLWRRKSPGCRYFCIPCGKFLHEERMEVVHRALREEDAIIQRAYGLVMENPAGMDEYLRLCYEDWTERRFKRMLNKMGYGPDGFRTKKRRGQAPPP